MTTPGKAIVIRNQRRQRWENTHLSNVLCERNKKIDSLCAALESVKNELGWFGSMVCEGPDVMPLPDVIKAAQRDLAKVHNLINEALKG